MKHTSSTGSLTRRLSNLCKGSLYHNQLCFDDTLHYAKDVTQSAGQRHSTLEFEIAHLPKEVQHVQ